MPGRQAEHRFACCWRDHDARAVAAIVEAASEYTVFAKRRGLELVQLNPYRMEFGDRDRRIGHRVLQHTRETFRRARSLTGEPEHREELAGADRLLDSGIPNAQSHEAD